MPTRSFLSAFGDIGHQHGRLPLPSAPTAIPGLIMRPMTNAYFGKAIQAFEDAITRVQVIEVPGRVSHAQRRELDQLQKQFRGIPGVAAPPEADATVQDLQNWALAALGALRAEQKRRLAALAPLPVPTATTDPIKSSDIATDGDRLTLFSPRQPDLG